MAEAARSPSLGSRVQAVAEAASFAVPCLFALFQASPTTRFSDDAALIRSLGGVPLGVEGLVSSALGSLFTLVPLGSRVLRLGWAAALGTGVSAWLIFRLALFVQRQKLAAIASDASGERLRTWVALATALTCGLGPLFVIEGSIPGGACVGAALALATTALAVGALDLPGPRRAFVVGALLAATALESRWAALGTACGLGFLVATRRTFCLRTARYLALGALVPLALPLAMIVSLLSASSMSSGLVLASLDGAPLAFAKSDRSVALGAWLAEVGLVACAVSLGGVGLGLWSTKTRPALLALCGFLVLDATLGSADVPITVRDPYIAVRLLAFASLAIAGALALSWALILLRTAKIAFARGVGVLLLVQAFTLALVSAEDGARAAELREQSATAVWTDEALQSLPASSTLLLKSEPLVMRLIAARATSGVRPDVLLVPLSLLERGGARARALSREEGLIPVVRDVLLNGRPGEFALSTLADTRPLYVEPDSSWDARLYSHLLPRPFFTEFSPHPLGRSDRRVGVEEADQALARVLVAARQNADDQGTRAVLAAELGQRTLVLAALGDREDARKVVATLRELEPDGELGDRLARRLSQPGDGPLNLEELFAAR